jgi:phosphatidylethanolamine/phosphatidyl-N-methylethanolamine N-methyltransferase
MSNRLADCRLFLQEFRRNFHSTGALAPSGQRLARTLAHYVNHRTDDRPKRILEVGPGTGAVTRQIIRRMQPADRLDLVEINENFVERLNDRFRNDPEFREVSPRAAVHCTRIENLHTDSPYDVVISGLPLNNFAVDEVEAVLSTLRRLTSERATLTFFQYMAIRRVKAFVSGRDERARLRGIDQVLGDLLKTHEFRRDWVWSNVPPAWVHHLKF